MVRGLMVVLAFAATAQAQDVSKAAKGTNPAAQQNGAQAATPLASQSAPGSRTGPLSPSTGTGRVSAGSGAGEDTSDMTADCSIVETLLHNDIPAVRIYQPPRSAQTGMPKDAGEQAPYLAAVVRCGRVYIFQIRTQSKDLFVIGEARLEGPNGETLRVTALRSRKEGWSWDINVIVAEAPPGMEVPKIKLNLMSEDGRAAQLEAGGLP